MIGCGDTGGVKSLSRGTFPMRHITFIRPKLGEGAPADAMTPLVFALLKAATPAEIDTVLIDERADHAFSPLDQREGAWNLTVSAFTRMAFLNYHFHLCHHRDPTVPWRSLRSRSAGTMPAWRSGTFCISCGPGPG
jgi:hypothetical protein